MEDTTLTGEEMLAELRSRASLLSTGQLEELLDEFEDEDQRQVVADLLQQRQDHISAPVAEAAPTKKRGRSGLRADQPKEVSNNAADLFMQDADRAATWNEALTEATDADGNVLMTGRIVQLAVGAYYAERRAKRRAQVKEAAPISTESDTQAEVDVPLDEDGTGLCSCGDEATKSGTCWRCEMVADQQQDDAAPVDKADDLLLDGDDLAADGFLPIQPIGKE